ncbi:hypothetical protein ACJX0J_040690, partial [Zea mays]
YTLNKSFGTICDLHGVEKNEGMSRMFAGKLQNKKAIIHLIAAGNAKPLLGLVSNSEGSADLEYNLVTIQIHLWFRASCALVLISLFKRYLLTDRVIVEHTCYAVQGYLKQYNISKDLKHLFIIFQLIGMEQKCFSVCTSAYITSG